MFFCSECGSVTSCQCCKLQLCKASMNPSATNALFVCCLLLVLFFILPRPMNNMMSIRCNEKHKSSAQSCCAGAIPPSQGAAAISKARTARTLIRFRPESNVNARATSTQLILTLEDSSLIQWLSPLDSFKKKTSAIMILCESSVASQVTVVT